MIDGSSIDLLIVGIAVLITVCAALALALGVYFSARDMWREYRVKRSRPGYIQLTPDRTRLGIDKGGRRRP